MATDSRDLRTAAMAWLDERPHERVDFAWLSTFEFDGLRVPLMDRQRGIRKPAGMDAALAIRTTFTPPGQTPPYADAIGPDGLQRYKYRGDDPSHPENVALRRAWQMKLPIMWFVGVEPGLYEPLYPVWVIGDSPQNLEFTLALDAAQRHFDATSVDLDEDYRSYMERLTKIRLHQRVFRTQVLLAYESHCAVCNLAHESLLDAAHIIADGQPDGLPVVPNGLAMCKIHHAAFDNRILGIRPDDLTLHIRQDILEEIDGPMLRHGLQEMHDRRLMRIPRSHAARPDQVRLEERYQEFLSA
ncbi:HNH endonuclease [Aeromicrobium terrae]|uniref:HNH endonuclease n=1 Tax=Aeromicrobium terrae TaxID=2498846 RepID=UPI00164FE7F8|nr:HNH endonuclease [Aeromicrobium terrae]